MGKVVSLTEALPTGGGTGKKAESGKDEWISVPGFGQLWRRGKTWWIKYSVDGRVYRESSKSTDQRDAEKLLRTRIKASRKGGRSWTLTRSAARGRWRVSMLRPSNS